MDADIDLVQRCRQGDTKAFEELVIKYQNIIYNTVLRIVHNGDDADDVTQITFIKVYEHLQSYDSRHKFFSWLYRIAVNEALNASRHAQREVPLTEDLAEEIPETPEESEERSRTLEEALLELTIDYRTVLVLKHLQGLSYSEISYILEIPEKLVKSRLFTARDILRKKLVSKGMMRYDD